MYILKRKGAPKKWIGTKSCVQEDKRIKKWKKASGDLKTRFHPAKFPTCEKELKKILKPGVEVHTFNPNTPKAETGRSLS